MGKYGEQLYRWDWNIEEEGRRSETFCRIRYLVRRGYQIDWSVDVDDALWVDHPSGGPALIVYANGTVSSRGFSGDNKVIINPNAPDEKDRFHNEDKQDAEAFDRWLTSIHKPNPWQ